MFAFFIYMLLTSFFICETWTIIGLQNRIEFWVDFLTDFRTNFHIYLYIMLVFNLKLNLFLSNYCTKLYAFLILK